jgi:hypothetical protein
MLVGIPALFAADAPSGFDLNNSGQFLPYAIGAVLTIGVIAVGLALSGKKSAGGQQAEDGSAQQLAGTRGASKPLEQLVLPGLGLLVTCGVVGVVVLSVTQSFSEASKNINTEAVQSAARSNFYIPMSQIVPEGKPLTPIQWSPQYQPPKINIPIQPPTPPHVPQVYIDSRGIIRSR